MKLDGREPAQLPRARGGRYALVIARYYKEMTDWLEDGARRGLIACGVEDERIEAFTVPGCFEVPLACKLLAADGRFEGLVALGVVIRGDTPHFDYVAGECARGIMNVQLETETPVGFGILTTETLAQAQERADPARLDKGFEAAVAAVALAALAS